MGNDLEAGDASLESLETDAGPIVPGLFGARSSFVVNVGSEVEAVRVSAKPTDLRASVRINGREVQGAASFPLAPDRNTFRIDVTAADGRTSKSYELKVIRARPIPDWVRVLEHAPFKIRDSEGELIFNDRMWVLGGYTPELVTDVWSSADGLDWKHAGDIPDDSGINIPVQFAHAGRMWVAANNGKFYSSPDGATWTLVTDRAPWAGRYAAGSAVFNDRMWVVGGMKDGVLFNDVWSSADGVEWRQELAGAPWSPRQVFGNLVVHHERLWLIGGGVTVYQPFRAYTDVWSSRDGRTWECATDAAPWPARIWSSCAVYRNRLWLLGGFRSQPTSNNFDDVWYSADGADWRRLVTRHVWEPRHELSPFTFQENLWVVAGNAWPLMNDVWQLDLPGLMFLTQPVLEEFVHARYRYESRADFNHSAQPVRYRLREAPTWLSVDATSGVVTGLAPSEPGEFRVALEAFDDAGETATQAFTLHVIRAAN